MMSYTGGGGERTGTSAALKCCIQSQNSDLSRHDTTIGLISFPGKRGESAQSLSFGSFTHWNVLWSDCHSGDKTNSFMEGYTL